MSFRNWTSCRWQSHLASLCFHWLAAYADSVLTYGAALVHAVTICDGCGFLSLNSCPT